MVHSLTGKFACGFDLSFDFSDAQLTLTHVFASRRFIKC